MISKEIRHFLRLWRKIVTHKNGQKSTTHTPTHKRIGANRTEEEMARKQGQATHLQWTPDPFLSTRSPWKNPLLHWFLRRNSCA